MEKAAKSVFLTLGVHLNIAVRQITAVPCEAPTSSLSLDEGAVVDSLHPASHQHVKGLHFIPRRLGHPSLLLINAGA